MNKSKLTGTLIFKKMLPEMQKVQISKFLSLVLRHDPGRIGIMLDESGWTEVPRLLQQLASHGSPLTFEALEEVVATNGKQRFAFNEDRSRIRASQGHSVSVSLGYTPVQPPAILYHGTARKNLPSVLREGLQKRSRHQVHLSAETETARQVGSRHGQPVVLAVDAAAMQEAGHLFYQSENGVWLTDEVPPPFLKEL